MEEDIKLSKKIYIIYIDNNYIMEFKNEYIDCKVEFIDNCKYVKISGMVNNLANFKNVVVMAPQTINKTSSYSGFGLPFPCADIAFEETPNIYDVDQSGIVNVVFTYPNSYYSVANKKKIVSSIFFVFETHDNQQEFVRLELKDLYPLRTLVNRESRTGPDFYSTKHEILPIDTAEVVMREYAKIKKLKDIA
jgi:hypothetical protein